MTTNANSCHGKKLLQKILLFVVAFLLVESILYFRNLQQQDCPDCTTHHAASPTPSQLSTSTKALKHSKLLATNTTPVSSSTWRDTITRSEERTKLKTVLTTSAIAIPISTSEVHFSSSTETTVTSSRNYSKTEHQTIVISENRKCLQYLLENNIVEYYYHPENDDDNLNFTTRGIRTKKRLSKEYTKPSLVLLFEPSDIYNESILPTNICSASVRSFMPNMRARDFDLLRNLLKFFKHVASLSGMEYYLNYGSLLGHVRFDKRPIPWDDDVDFSVDYSVLKRFRGIFKRERKIYFKDQNTSTFLPEFHTSRDRMKIFDKTQKRIRKYSWTFPFLDLFFYSMPEEDFYDLTEEEMAKLVLTEASHSSYALNVSLRVMLPLKKEHFLGVKLMMPVDSEKFLQLQGYHRDICAPLGWLHRYERKRHGLSHDTIKCSLLEGFYEFWSIKTFFYCR